MDQGLRSIQKVSLMEKINKKYLSQWLTSLTYSYVRRRSEPIACVYLPPDPNIFVMWLKGKSRLIREKDVATIRHIPIDMLLTSI